MRVINYFFILFSLCYKSVQSFRVTCLFTGQYNTKGYGIITDVKQWISFLFGSKNYSSHNYLAWLLGFVGNHSLLLFVQYCHHHIETRQIQYNSQVYRTLVELVHKKLDSSLELQNRSSPGVEAHHSVSSLDAGRNSGGRRIKKTQPS